MIAVFLAFKYAVYDISHDFGYGFIVGGIIMFAIVALGFHIDERERWEQRERELLARISGNRPTASDQDLG